VARSKITFDGPSDSLAEAPELPDPEPKAYVLFAHCFICGKDSAASSRISRTLAANGIGVLRFDFTGLGGSDGDFANAGFSSNITDLIAAADWLRQTHGPPALHIGHSLGEFCQRLTRHQTRGTNSPLAMCAINHARADGQYR
jgi:alpha/beta superfamily hydrolase